MTTTDTAPAPNTGRGRLFDDFGVGDVIRSRLRRTITEIDNVWFTALTVNSNQMHFNAPYASSGGGRVGSTRTATPL